MNVEHSKDFEKTVKKLSGKKNCRLSQRLSHSQR